MACGVDRLTDPLGSLSQHSSRYKGTAKGPVCDCSLSRSQRQGPAPTGDRWPIRAAPHAPPPSPQPFIILQRLCAGLAVGPHGRGGAGLGAPAPAPLSEATGGSRTWHSLLLGLGTGSVPLCREQRGQPAPRSAARLLTAQMTESPGKPSPREPWSWGISIASREAGLWVFPPGLRPTATGSVLTAKPKAVPSEPRAGGTGQRSGDWADQRRARGMGVGNGEGRGQGDAVGGEGPGHGNSRVHQPGSVVPAGTPRCSSRLLGAFSWTLKWFCRVASCTSHPAPGRAPVGENQSRPYRWTPPAVQPKPGPYTNGFSLQPMASGPVGGSSSLAAPPSAAPVPPSLENRGLGASSHRDHSVCTCLSPDTPMQGIYHTIRDKSQMWVWTFWKSAREGQHPTWARTWKYSICAFWRESREQA